MRRGTGRRVPARERKVRRIETIPEVVRILLSDYFRKKSEG